MRHLLIIFLICCCTSKEKKPLAVSPEKELQDYMLTAFEEMMKATPYTALIQHYKIESFPIEDTDANDEFAEKKVLFYANVIETFNGKHQDKIVYEMIVDINEDDILNKEPTLICLCEKKGRLIWPGTGSIFPNTPSLINKANEIKKNGDFNTNKSGCL